MLNILTLKPDHLSAFLPLMQNNAHESRKEPGNEAFWVFQDEQGGNTLYLIESWTSQSALDAHMRTAPLRAVQKAGQQALASPPVSLPIKATTLVPAFDLRPVQQTGHTRNVLVRLHVQPTAKKDFLQIIQNTLPQARKAHGNLIYDFFEVKDDPDQFILFERWDSVASHEANLTLPYAKKLGAILPSLLASASDRHLLKDVAP